MRAANPTTVGSAGAAWLPWVRRLAALYQVDREAALVGLDPADAAAIRACAREKQPPEKSTAGVARPGRQGDPNCQSHIAR